MSAAYITGMRATGTNEYEVSANVTGQAGVGSDLTMSTVEVVYDVVPGNGTPSTPAMCSALPAAPMVFNGNLTYSGGALGVTNANNNYKNIAIAGSLTIGSGSTATISGCAKGDVNISGGGITNNGHIYSDGDITLQGMQFPQGSTLWGKDVILNGGSDPNGTLTDIWAGGFQTDVYSGTQIIGTAIVGGTLIPSTVPTPAQIPWTTGTVLPSATPGDVVVTLADGVTQFLLDFSNLTIDSTTGAVTGASSAQQIAGPQSTSGLPNVLFFQSTGIAGGTVTMGSGATLSVSDRLWGHNVTINPYSQTFPTLWANGNLVVSNDTIGTLVGGGNLQAINGSCSGAVCSNFPTVGSGTLAGAMTYGSGNSPLPSDWKTTLTQQSNPLLPNVQQQVPNTTPGLPGLPWCDTRVNAVDADSLKSFANYVFEVVNGQPQLTIQNVKTAAGVSLDGVYPLINPTPAQLTVLQSLMTCNWGNDRGCLQTWQSNTGTNGTWVLSAIEKMPVGVLWFDHAVTITSAIPNLIDTIVNKGGDVTLNNSGDTTLTAPNFAGATAVCGADPYPTNLCASQNPPALATWSDASGTVHTGLPIANMAVITEDGMTASSWTTINGNVMLGGQLNTSGAAVNILGSLTVGSNGTSNATISAGGANVTVPTNGDQSQLPVCSGGTPAASAPATIAKVLWSRYL